MPEATASNKLQGMTVLVTRPAHQSENLSRLIASAGGCVIKFPTLAITARTNTEQIRATLSQLTNYQWLVFVSVNAVNFALRANGGKISQFESINSAAIGQATAQALAEAGHFVTLMPTQGYSSEALLAMPALQKVDGKKILIVRGEGGREQLADSLRNRGAHVEYLEVYKREIAQTDTTQVCELLEANKLGALTVTSGEALQNLLVLLAEQTCQYLYPLPLVVVSERIGQIAAEKGFTNIIVAESPSDRAVLEALIKLMGKIAWRK